MASMPQAFPPQRQSSQEPATNTTDTPSPVLSSSSHSSHSDDSQVVILDHHDAASAGEDEQQPPQAAKPLSSTTQPLQQSPDEPDSELKKCWICFSDASEDTPTTSPWRDPCPCALVAHEECLLDWIADLESPKNIRNRSLGTPQLACPQCKGEIRLARPRNYVVDVARGVERLASRVVWPGALVLLSGAIVQANVAFGRHTIYHVFGAEDGHRILQPLMRRMIAPPIDLALPPRQIIARSVYEMTQMAQHWRVHVGVPLITPLLILSRTSLADSVLPALPVLFLATQAHSSGEAIDFTAWPPSASMAFAVLPFLRSAYNFYYEQVWAAKEQEWIREIQPRQQDAVGEQQAEAAEDGAAAPADEDNMFEVRIDGGIWEDWQGNNGEQGAAQNDQAANNVMEPEPQRRDAAAPPPNVVDNRPVQAQPDQQAPVQQAPAQQGERRLAFSTTAVAENVLGALAFPTIAHISSEVLRFALPSSWTTVPSTGARGLLQLKWGRTMVGGCLFVVLKDALMLYVRWRSAKMHRERKVLDFDRTKKTTKA